MARPDRGPIFVLDASAWIDCNERAGDNRIPVLLNRLYAEGRLCSPKEVFKELERPGEISDWAKERRTKLNAPHGMPRDYALNIGRVQFQFPAMGGATGTKQKADPYVVALALTFNREDRPWIVVAGETRANRPRRKIRGVCDELKLECLSIDELMERLLPEDGDEEIDFKSGR